ncbi:MAG: hypothetical protein ABUS47_05205 [Steroidobacter sp.]
MQFDNVLKYLDQQVSFLAKWGYAKTSEKIYQSSALGEQLHVLYVSAAAARKIDFHYTPKRERKIEFISVFVDTLDGKSVSFEDLLEKKGQKDIAGAFANPGNSLETHELFERFGVAFQRACETGLNEIVTGKDWIDVPVDWSPYR